MPSSKGMQQFVARLSGSDSCSTALSISGFMLASACMPFFVGLPSGAVPVEKRCLVDSLETSPISRIAGAVPVGVTR